jgi:carbamoyl-phosphate synthase large subunit
MKSLNVLFLGGAKRVSFAEYLKCSAETRGFSFHLFSYETKKEVPIAIAGEVIVGLRWNDPSLYADLCQLIRSKNIQMVLPFVDPAITVASELKSLLPDVYIPCSSKMTCDIMFDKQRSADWFEFHGLPIPRTCHPDEKLFFPLIAKPRDGSASKGIEVMQDREEFTCFTKRHTLNEYLFQQYVEKGEEFTVDAFVAQDQRIISVVPRIRLEQAGGESIRSLTVRDKTIEGLSMKILETKAFSGPVTIQFIRDRQSGETYVMEVNPRYGGAVITSFAAGADTTGCLVDECNKQTINPLTQWKENVLMTRSFKEVIFYANNH